MPTPLLVLCLAALPVLPYLLIAWLWNRKELPP